MTENKRYTTDNGSNEDVCLVDNVTGKEFESDFDEIVDLLNEQEETIQELRKERDYFERKKEEFLSRWSIVHSENIQLKQENKWLKQSNKNLGKIAYPMQQYNGDVE